MEFVLIAIAVGTQCHNLFLIILSVIKVKSLDELQEKIIMLL